MPAIDEYMMLMPPYVTFIVSYVTDTHDTRRHLIRDVMLHNVGLFTPLFTPPC